MFGRWTPMSLPNFPTQAELFSTAALSASLFPEADRYRLFAKLVYPPLAGARASLEKCYCPENGRTALEPVLLLGVSIFQDLDGVPDRKAVEILKDTHSQQQHRLNGGEYL